MEETIENLIEQLLQGNDVYLYLMLFVSSVVENLFPPIPGDTITALGAFLVGKGRLNYWMVYMLTVLGSLCGFMILYAAGRFLGLEFFEKRKFKIFSSDGMVSAQKWFSKYGYGAVLANRFIPGIRSAVSAAAGIAGLSPWKTAAAAAASACIWNLLWIQAGYSLGNNWSLVKEKIADMITGYNIIALSVIGAAAVFCIIRRKIRKRKQEK